MDQQSRRGPKKGQLKALRAQVGEFQSLNGMARLRTVNWLMNDKASLEQSLAGQDHQLVAGLTPTTEGDSVMETPDKSNEGPEALEESDVGLASEYASHAAMMSPPRPVHTSWNEPIASHMVRQGPRAYTKVAGTEGVRISTTAEGLLSDLVQLDL